MSAGETYNCQEYATLKSNPRESLEVWKQSCSGQVAFCVLRNIAFDTVRRRSVLHSPYVQEVKLFSLHSTLMSCNCSRISVMLSNRISFLVMIPHTRPLLMSTTRI